MIVFRGVESKGPSTTTPLEAVAMATLLPSLSSDEEDKNVDSEEEEDDEEVNRDFSFGGILVRAKEGVVFGHLFVCSWLRF